MHLFYVHSNICFKICLEIINKYAIDNNDIIFISGRGFYREYLKETRWIEDGSFKDCKPNWSFLSSFLLCRSFDLTIKNSTSKRKFHAYIPQSTIPFVELLITHKLCSGYSYIEEGYGSYRSAEDIEKLYPREISFLTKIKMLAWQNRINSHQFFDFDKCDKVFCTSELAFPEAKRKIILENVFKTTKNDFSCRKFLYCIFDAISIFYEKLRLAHIQSFIIGVHKIFDKNQFEGIKVKFHPAQINSPEYLLFQNAILLEFGSKTNVEFLSPEFDFEEFMINSKKLKILLLCSSIGLYAKRIGHKTYSFSSIFIEKLPSGCITSTQISYIRNVSSEFSELL